MSESLDPTSVLSAIQAGMTGGEPPLDLLNRVGGWAALEALAPTLVDDPLLTPIMSLLARDAEIAAQGDQDLAVVRSAAAALASAVLDSTDPLQFVQGLETLCARPVLADLVGEYVGLRCFGLAGPPVAEEADQAPKPASVVRHATALETLARLAVQKRASMHKLLGIIEDIKEPQPRRYALAVARSVSLAFDHWSPGDEIAHVIDVLSGVAAPRSAEPMNGVLLARNEEYRLAIASDAIWVKANVEVVRALRATTVDELLLRLDGALIALGQVAELDDREDVELLRAALRLLQKLLVSLHPARVGFHDAANWELEVSAVEALARRAKELTFGAHGLNHWSGDRKLVVLQGWARFAQDLGWLREKLERDSLYDAAVVLDDIMAIYSASRTYDVISNEQGVERVMQVIRPAVAGGFAARAGLMRNLSDHIESLRGRIAAGPDSGEDVSALESKVKTAETVFFAARTNMLSISEPPGKPDERVSALPPLLANFLKPHPIHSDALAGVDEAALAELAAELADHQAATGLEPDLIITEVRKRILGALSSCEDFSGDVAPAVTQVLDQLIRFVARRMNTQESTKSYLFDPYANEKELHIDLYDWLSQGQLSGKTTVESQEVGGGRVDIQIQFTGFNIYLELKSDNTRVPVERKAAYINQTASYQATAVRIGFLVVLRTKPPKDKTLPQHLTDYVTHTTVQVAGSTSNRHVVMLEVPGGRTKPSAQR